MKSLVLAVISFLFFSGQVLAQATPMTLTLDPNPTTIRTPILMSLEGGSGNRTGVIWEAQKDGRLPQEITPIQQGDVWQIQFTQAGVYRITATVGAERASREIDVRTTFTLNEAVNTLLQDAQEVRGDANDPLSVRLTEQAQNTTPKYLVGVDGTAEGTTSDVTSLLQRIANGLISLAGILAVLIILRQGMVMVVSFGDADAFTQAKKGIQWAFAGLLVISLAFIIVRTVVTLISIGDTITPPQDEASITALCPDNVKPVYANIEESLQAAENQLAQAETEARKVRLYSRYIDSLYESFKDIPQVLAPNNSGTLQDLEPLIDARDEATELEQEVSTRLDDINRRVAQLQSRLFAAKSTCNDFPETDFALTRAQRLESDTLTPSAGGQSLQLETETIANEIRTHGQTIQNLFEALYDAPDIRWCAEGAANCRNGSLNDFDADGIPNSDEINRGADPLNPLQ